MEEPGGSVTHWIALIREGDADATQAIWQRYFPQLVQQARNRMRGPPSGLADEEDVAISVMESLFRAAADGRFPDLTDRDDLWRLVLSMTIRKVVDLKRHEYRARRGGGRLQSEADLEHANGFDEGAALAQFAGEEPTPAFVVAMAEECRHLLSQLQDEELQKLALAKLEGHTNGEIAAQLDCSERTVERRLRLIRRKWDSGPPP